MQIYKVITSGSPDDLAYRVTDFIRTEKDSGKHWEATGGVAVAFDSHDDATYAQAFIRVDASQMQRK